MILTEMITGEIKRQAGRMGRSEKIFDILTSPVEQVAPWIAGRVLENTRNGARIQWSSGAKMMGRFLLAPFRRPKK